MKIDDKYLHALQTMMGDEFIYQGRTVIPIDVEAYDDGKIIINVEKGHSIHTTHENLKETLKEFLPTTAPKNEPEITNEQEVAVGKQPDSKPSQQLISISSGKNLNILEDILMDNINKLKTNRAYLDQAKEINSHVNSIIKIAKTKIDMVREIRKQTQSQK